MTGVDWPSGFEQTPERDRSPNRSFEVSFRVAIEDLADEMGRLDADEWRLSTALDHQSQNPNYPYPNQPEPDDPGVALRWTMDGGQYAVACDAHTRVRDNLRTIGLYVREKRKMETRPVETGESEFANARLPPADQEDVVVAGADSEPAYEVLEVDADAADDVVEAAFRAKAKDVHPDQGGSRAEWQRLQEAREVMLDG